MFSHLPLLFISQQHILKDECGLIMKKKVPENIIENIHEQVMTLPFLPSCLLPLAVLSVFPLTVFFEMLPKSSETRQSALQIRLLPCILWPFVSTEAIAYVCAWQAGHCNSCFALWNESHSRGNWCTSAMWAFEFSSSYFLTALFIFFFNFFFLRNNMLHLLSSWEHKCYCFQENRHYERKSPQTVN